MRASSIAVPHLGQAGGLIAPEPAFAGWDRFMKAPAPAEFSKHIMGRACRLALRLRPFWVAVMGGYSESWGLQIARCIIWRVLDVPSASGCERYSERHSQNSLKENRNVPIRLSPLSLSPNICADSGARRLWSRT
jgi:hypothetical protein